MRETIKSIFLFSLVALSLGLTYFLWFSTPDYEVSTPLSSERISFSSPRTYETIMLPVKTVIDYGNQFYTIIRPDSKNFVKQMELLSKTLDYYKEGSYSIEQFNLEDGDIEPAPSIIFVYTYPFILDGPADSGFALENVSIFPEEGRAIAKTIDDLYLVVKDADDLIESWLIPPFEEELHYSLAEDLMRGELENIIEGITLASGLLIPEDDQTLPFPAISVKRETLNIERMLRIFFLDLSLIRTIEERDGAVIYTDGQKGLRNYNSGAIEITVPSNNSESVFVNKRSVETINETISLYGGWQDHLYLWEAYYQEESGSKTGLNFRLRNFFNGYPVIGQRGIIDISLSGSRNFSYYHRKLVKKNNLSDEEYVKKNFAEIREEVFEYIKEKDLGNSENPILNEIYPAYYSNEELDMANYYLYPVWVFDFGKDGVIVSNGEKIEAKLLLVG